MQLGLLSRLKLTICALNCRWFDLQRRWWFEWHCGWIERTPRIRCPVAHSAHHWHPAVGHQNCALEREMRFSWISRITGSWMSAGEGKACLIGSWV